MTPSPCVGEEEHGIGLCSSGVMAVEVCIAEEREDCRKIQETRAQEEDFGSSGGHCTQVQFSSMVEEIPSDDSGCFT